MQRYFLIFSIIFLSYLLLINYNPPVDSFNEDISVSDSEYSLSTDTDDFVSDNDIVVINKIDLKKKHNFSPNISISLKSNKKVNLFEIF